MKIFLTTIILLGWLKAINVSSDPTEQLHEEIDSIFKDTSIDNMTDDQILNTVYGDHSEGK